MHALGNSEFKLLAQVRDELARGFEYRFTTEMDEEDVWDEFRYRRQGASEKISTFITKFKTIVR